MVALLVDVDVDASSDPYIWANVEAWGGLEVAVRDAVAEALLLEPACVTVRQPERFDGEGTLLEPEPFGARP